MPFYLFQGSYSTDSIKALISKPEDRTAAAAKVIEAAGGTLHHMFLTFGSDDVIAIMELPDDVAAASASMTIGASGALSSGRTTRLLTMEEGVAAMTAAGSISGTYRPPS